MPRSQTLTAGSRPAHRPPVSPLLRLLYNVVYLCGLVVYLPVLLRRMFADPRHRLGLRERAGFVASSPPGADVVWVHGVSVGEVKAAKPLVDALERMFPKLLVRVSSTTPAGYQVAARLFGGERVFHFPLDWGPFPRRAIERLAPRAILLVELELWPNLLLSAERAGVPVAVVNGRISAKSFRGYRFLRHLLPQLDRMDLFCVQNDVYARRLERLGVPPERIEVTGNLKYDELAIADGPPPKDPELAALLALAPADLVLVGGSIHPGEEGPLARAALEAERRLGRRVRLVLAPRHPEKTPKILRGIRRVLDAAGQGARPLVRRTAEDADGGRPDAWLVLDTIGELGRAYSLADLVFVGGSLIRHGGQNMLEPVSLRKPTLFGPHVWNFQLDAELLLAGRGARLVEDGAALSAAVTELLADPRSAQAMAARAVDVLRRNRGAAERTLARLAPLIAATGARR